MPADRAPPPASNDPSSLGPPLFASEAVLAGLAWIFGRWSGIDWAAMVRPTTEGAMLGALGGLGLVALHLVLMCPGGRRNPLYRHLYVPLYRLVGPWARSAPVFILVAAALASGVAEELFFRGWLQTQTTLVVASVLFGACHLWGRGALPYAAYAAGMGAVLGGLFVVTGQHLWAPALAHVLNNLIGLLALKYDWAPVPAP